MASLNKVLMIGRLTRDPEKRSTPGGTTVTEFGMALNRRFRGADGKDREETCFVDVTVWGRQGEVAANYLRKGAQVFIEGRLRMDEWERDGQKRRKLSVVAENFQFLDPASGRERRAEFTDAPDTAPEPAREQARSARPPAAAAESDEEFESLGAMEEEDEDVRDQQF